MENNSNYLNGGIEPNLQWTNEDDDILNNIVWILRQNLDELKLFNAPQSLTEPPIKYINWLEGLRDRFNK